MALKASNKRPREKQKSSKAGKKDQKGKKKIEKKEENKKQKSTSNILLTTIVLLNIVILFSTTVVLHNNKEKFESRLSMVESKLSMAGRIHFEDFTTTTVLNDRYNNTFYLENIGSPSIAITATEWRNDSVLVDIFDIRPETFEPNARIKVTLFTSGVSEPSLIFFSGLLMELRLVQYSDEAGVKTARIDVRVHRTGI